MKRKNNEKVERCGIEKLFIKVLVIMISMG